MTWGRFRITPQCSRVPSPALHVLTSRLLWHVIEIVPDGGPTVRQSVSQVLWTVVGKGTHNGYEPVSVTKKRYEISYRGIPFLESVNIWRTMLRASRLVEPLPSGAVISPRRLKIIFIEWYSFAEHVSVYFWVGGSHGHPWCSPCRDVSVRRYL
jgi:hypothetical protein